MVTDVAANRRQHRFRQPAINGGKVQKVFNIQNTGSATLTLGEVSATGDFSVIVQPGTSIAPGGDANFTIRGTGI
jgi:hypothetical protein